MESIWIIVLATAALLIRAGQLLGAMGFARAKNVASAGLRALADFCVATLAYWALGAAIALQLNNRIFGVDPKLLFGRGELGTQWLMMLVMVLIGTGAIGSVVAERSRLIVPLTLGAVLAGLVMPIVLSWTRFGWLWERGFIDAAGAASVHLAPAVGALIAAIIVRPREGKYNRDRSANMIPGHSVSMIFTSVLLMLVGWSPYIISAAPSLPARATAANVLVCAAAGGLTALLVGHFRFGKADVLLTCSGLMGGLVAITAAASRVGSPAAFLIGVVAGILVPWMTIVIDLRLKIDDPGGVIAVHGVGAIWALLAAAIFSNTSPGAALHDLGVQLVGIIAIVCLAGAFMMGAMLILLSTTGVRSKDTDEFDGLDLAEHDINAHPDFQQTMIKSYHLREA